MPAIPLKMVPIGCPETSVRKCHSTLRDIPEERRNNQAFNFRFTTICSY